MSPARTPRQPARMIGGHKVRFSRHALDRILDMAVDEWEVQAALVSPRYVRPSPKDPELTCYQKGRIVLITATDEHDVLTVVTVFWSTGKLWAADFATADYLPEAGRTDRAPEPADDPELRARLEVAFGLAPAEPT